jgi:hypothetical protein
MIEIKTLETSSWLKRQLTTTGNKLTGTILAVYNNSLISFFNDLGLIHITGKKENLSPVSIAIDKFDPSFYRSNEPIIFENGHFYVENLDIYVDQNLSVYNERVLDHIENIENLYDYRRKIQEEIKTFIENNVNIISEISSSSRFYIDTFELNRQLVFHSIQTRNIDVLQYHLQKLIGLGEGLTPSGDDYIVGLIYALHISQEKELLLALQPALLKSTELLTNNISGTFIKHAVYGRFSKNIIRNKWLSLLKHGHTSGYYTLLGINDCLNTGKNTLYI